jgi:serine/threonine-protein kinase
MALEWVDGEPLSLLMSEAAKSGGIPRPIGANLIAQACKGLHAAHELTDESGAPLGVVHRDISPHNILVTYGGIAKLVDFGIAKATQRSSELTEAGEVKGKLAYMAPEQVVGRPVDRRTDIFALGTILYALTTGRHPWRGDHPGMTTERLISPRPAKPPSSIVADYPPALEAVVLKALHKDPDQRFATAQEFLGALEEAVPSSLEGNSEARVAEFMKGLIGPRGVERRKQIRLAGELLDQRRALTGITMTGTGGSSSAVAVAVDADALSRMNHTGSIGVGTGSQTPAVRNARRRLDKIVWVAIAAVAAGIGFAATRMHNGADAPTEKSAAVSAAAPPSVAVEAPRPSAPEPAATQAPAPEPAEPETADGDKRKKGKGERPSARASRVYTPPVAAPQPTTAPAPAPAAAPAPEATTASPPASANAWNPKTFGNRY